MDQIFLTLLNRSISAGWLILAIIILRLLLRKAPRRIVCLLWAIAAVRLACPVSVESVFSLIPSAQTLSPEAVQYAAHPTIQSGMTVIDNAVNPVIETVFAAPPSPVISANPLHVWMLTAGLLWTLGMLVILGWGMLGYLRLRLRVREAAWLHGRIWACDRIGSPFILGIFRPRIYLPSGMTAEQTRYVLAHEYAHLQRRDHWWKLLGYVLLAVYWFHPLVWAGYILFCRDVELACDERAIRNLSFQERKDYSRALLACSTQGVMVAACPLAFGEVGVKARIQAVLRYRRPAAWMAVIGAVVCVAAAVCFLTDPKKETPYFYEGAVFTYEDTSFDLAAMRQGVTSIVNCTPAGDTLVIECAMSSSLRIYGFFDTVSRSFQGWIVGTNLIWQGDDLSTAVYVYMGRLYRQDGTLLAELPWEAGAYVSDIVFQEDGSAVVVSIAKPTEALSITVSLADPVPAPEAYSYHDTVFVYGNDSYDMTEVNPLVNSIMDCTRAGDKLVVDCHISPNYGYYGIFDTASRSFMQGISGAHLTWQGDDLSTAVYDYAGRLFRYGSILLADLALEEGAYVYNLAFTDDQAAVVVTIVNNEQARTVTVPLTALSGPTPDTETDYTAYAAYNDLIALATEALITHQRPEGQEEDPFSYLFYMESTQTYQTMGWLLRDIDGDGVEELLFGENDNSGWNGIVYDLYTLSGGEAVHLFSGWERSRYYLCENGAIACEGSGGASYSRVDYYAYQSGELRLIESLRYVTGADGVQRTYYTTDPDLPEEDYPQISQAQAEAVEAKYVYVLPQFTPFTAQ